MNPKHHEFDPDGDVILVLPRRLEQLDESSEDCSLDKDSCAGIRMRVSSKHLALASSVFRTMFQIQFKECLAFRATGRLELPLPDDHPGALEILLNTVHGRLRRVPRRVSFYMLIHITILVDKDELQEAVEVFSDMWIEELKSSVPCSFTKGLLPWICISWVFKRPVEFKLTTQIAQCEGKDRIEAQVDEYPIPDVVVSAIDESREGALSEVIHLLQSLLKGYQTSSHCRSGGDQGFNCDSMVLGALMKRLQSIDLLPPPDPPYKGLSFRGLVQQLRDSSFPTFCDELDRHDGYSVSYRQSKGGSCGFKKKLEDHMKTLEDSLSGVDLSNLSGVHQDD